MKLIATIKQNGAELSAINKRETGKNLTGSLKKSKHWVTRTRLIARKYVEKKNKNSDLA